MIIKSSRVQASSGHNPLYNHLLKEDDNEAVHVLMGGECSIISAFDDAKNWKRKYAVRHYSIAPSEKINQAQLNDILKALRQEFNFNTDNITIVKHVKERADKTSCNEHYHMLIPEVDPLTGKVLDNKADYLRIDKICRELEVKFNHPITPTRNMKSVVKRLKEENKHDIASQLERYKFYKESIQTAYTDSQFQTAKRKGISLSEQKQIIKDTYNNASNINELKAELAKHNLSIQQGNKRDSTYIVMHNDTFIGVLHRLAKQKKNDVHNFVSKGIENANNRESKQQPASQQQQSTISEKRDNRINQEGHIGDSRPADTREGGGRRSHNDSSKASSRVRSEDREEIKYDREQARRNTRKNISAIKRKKKYHNNKQSLYDAYNDTISTLSQPKAPPPPQPKRKFNGGGNPWLGKRIYNEKQAEAVSYRWQKLGYEASHTKEAAVINGEGWRMVDFGNKCVINKATDDSVRALITKARVEWNSAIECYGNDEFLNAAWLEAQRQGVDFSVENNPSWQPSEATMEAWKAEKAASYQERSLEVSDSLSDGYEDDWEPAPIEPPSAFKM